MTPDLAQEAHDYAAQGWAVFPLQPRQKKPYGFTTGLHGASADVEVVTRMWAGRQPLPLRAPKNAEEATRFPDQVLARPNSNIGLATGARSRVWALDIDGRAGIDSLLALARQHGKLPLTVRQNTGKGGHLLFEWPGALPWGGEIRNGASKFAEGLDVRGEGGYIVLPPSIHPDTGRSYQWVEGCAPHELAIARAPWWLLRLVAPPPPRPSPPPPAARRTAADAHSARGYANAALDQACAEVAAAAPGTQNQTLHRNAYGIGRLVAGGELSRDQAASALLNAGLRMSNGDARRPWTHKDVSAAIDNAFRRAERDPKRAPEGGRG